MICSTRTHRWSKVREWRRTNAGNDRLAALGRRECSRLQQELEATRARLQACMHSIRTFWSPELKRERAARKEDAARLAALTSDLQRAHTEKQARALPLLFSHVRSSVCLHPLSTSVKSVYFYT